jgi:Na+/H+-translocating membrane pyrophosphatase
MNKTTDKLGGTAALAGAAIGSAALAAALLYASRRKEREANQPPRTSTAPHTPPPETD